MDAVYDSRFAVRRGCRTRSCREPCLVVDMGARAGRRRKAGRVGLQVRTLDHVIRIPKSGDEQIGKFAEITTFGGLVLGCIEA